jgi:sugar (pentulose or hexulose) kinase
MGAALLAGVGAGVVGSLQDAVQRLVQFDRVFEPRRDYRALYDDRFGKFRELYATLRPFNASYAEQGAAQETAADTRRA